MRRDKISLIKAERAKLADSAIRQRNVVFSQISYIAFTLAVFVGLELRLLHQHNFGPFSSFENPG